MVVLINEGTRSAKELLTFQFKKSKRAKLVGKRTAGAFIAAGMFTVGKTGALELPVMDLRLDGEPLEGRGVAPDIEVEAKDSYTERDTQLKAAKSALLKEMKR